jgi:hypothetical protein
VEATVQRSGHSVGKGTGSGSRWPRLIAAFLVTAGWANGSVADNGTAVGPWQLSRQESNCILDGKPDGHPFRLVLGISKNSKLQIMMLEFVDPSFALPTKEPVPVVLAFDSGKIESDNFGKETGVEDRYATIIMTEDLKKSIDVLSKASRVTVTAKATSKAYSLPGIGAAVQEMYQCAERYAT